LLYSCINCIYFDLEYISSRYLSSCGIEGKAYRCKCVLDSSIIYMYIHTVVLLQKCFHSDNICGERARKPCVEAATGNDKANQKIMCSWGNLTLPKLQDPYSLFWLSYPPPFISGLKRHFFVVQNREKK